MGGGSSFFEDAADVGLNVATGGIYGGYKAAAAEGAMAEAQLKRQIADRRLALKYAEATPEELAQLNRAIAVNEADVQRKEKLLASADPALIEAGTQALALLRGEESKTLAPLRTQFQKQESELRNKLMSQLGSGYETSTAGIQALTALRESQNAQLVGAQEKTLGMLLGTAQNVSNQGYGAAAGTAGSLAQLFGNIQGRKINALFGAPINAENAFAGDLARARAGISSAEKGAELAGTVLGAATGTSGLGGAAGGQKPIPFPT